MNRDISALPGFHILATLTKDQRPVVWINELGTGNAGRMFYTIRGHDKAVYQEPDFKQLVLNGVLWATHRLN
jgi:type 1 glutamine amidotransferase